MVSGAVVTNLEEESLSNQDHLCAAQRADCWNPVFLRTLAKEVKLFCFMGMDWQAKDTYYS